MDAVVFEIGRKARSDLGRASAAVAETMALSLEIVEEVVRFGRLTPVPLGPPSLLGATPWRGQVLPVIDAARLLGLASSRPDHADSCLRVNLGSHHLLLFVGRKMELRRLAPDERSLLLEPQTLLTLIEDDLARARATWVTRWSAP